MKFIIFALLIAITGCAMTKEYPITDHYDGQRFYNPGINMDKPFSDLIKWNMNRPESSWPDFVENKAQPQIVTQLENHQTAVTFINHVTFLIQLKEINIITDPVFSERASPVQFAGPKRIRKPGMLMDQLPKIDVVLVSHNHYDHMDLNSLEKLYKKFNPLFIVPLGNEHYIKNFAPNANVIELDWFQKTDFKNTEFFLTPAQHWSARGLFDRREALWGGFVIRKNNKQIYFVGDSGYNNQLFKKIKEVLGPMQLSFIPIGAYEPRWFMKNAHMNPEEAVMTHFDVQSTRSIGMHYGTFKMTDESYDQPVKDLETAKKKYQTDSIGTLNEGQTEIINL